VHYRIYKDRPTNAGTQSLPEDGIVLPKYVEAIVKSKETYNLVHLLVCLYILFNSIIKTNQFMMEVAQVAVCSQINTKHINTVWAEQTVLELVHCWCIT
jgi:hypothetical protein